MKSIQHYKFDLSNHGIWRRTFFAPFLGAFLAAVYVSGYRLKVTIR